MEGEHGVPALRVVFRIIDGDAILEPAVRQHAQTLGERQLLGMWQARRIHHGRVAQSGGAYHESAALPASDGKTHRERQRRIGRTGSQIDDAEPSIPAVDERDAVGVRADFQRIRHREDAGHSGARAPGRRIEGGIALGETLAPFGIELRCLGGERRCLALRSQQGTRCRVGHPDAEQRLRTCSRCANLACRSRSASHKCGDAEQQPNAVPAHDHGSFDAAGAAGAGGAGAAPPGLAPTLAATPSSFCPSANVSTRRVPYGLPLRAGARFIVTTSPTLTLFLRQPMLMFRLGEPISTDHWISSPPSPFTISWM